MKSLLVVLPLPPIEVSPNYRSRTHHARMRGIASYREAARVIGLAAKRKEGWEAPDLAVARSTFYLGRTRLKKAGGDDRLARPKDRDNAMACLKAAFDGLCDAGVIQGDTAAHFRPDLPVLYSRVADHQGEAKVVIWIEEASREP